MNRGGEVVNVLVADVSPNHAEDCAQQLREAGLLLHCQHAGGRDAIAAALETTPPDLVLYSSRLTDPDCRGLVAQLGAGGSDAAVIVIYDPARVEAAHAVVDAITAGARDAVSRANPTHLRLAAQRELAALRERRQLARMQREIVERERRWQALMEGSRDPVAYVHGGMHVHANASYLHMFGFERLDELEGLPVMDLVAPECAESLRDALRHEGPQQLELEVQRADGHRLAVRLEMVPATYDDEACWQLMLRDQSERRAIRAQLEYLRERDPLTGLYNRDRLLQGVRQAPPPASLMCLELDNYHLLRDSFGLTSMDGVVVDVASLLGSSVPPGCELARVGENVFGLLVPDMAGDDAGALAERLRKRLSEHVCAIDDRSVSTTCSIGVVFKQDPRSGVEGLLRKVQEACAQARASGGNRVVHALEAGAKQSSKGHSQALAHALEAGKLTLAFQPIVNLDDESMEIFEVLLRADNEAGEPLPMAELFDGSLPADLAIAVDRWVLEHTLELLSERVAGGHATRLFVNITMQALLSERFIEQLAGLLQRGHVPADRLVLEVAESAAVTRVLEVKTFLAALRELGCGSAIEHFGAGMSSPATLRQLRFDFVKLHASLVQGLGRSAEAEATLQAIVDVSRELNRPVVAFGVEQPETLARLWSVGISYAQGLAVQPPGPRLEWTYSTNELA